NLVADLIALGVGDEIAPGVAERLQEGEVPPGEALRCVRWLDAVIEEAEHRGSGCRALARLDRGQQAKHCEIGELARGDSEEPALLQNHDAGEQALARGGDGAR